MESVRVQLSGNRIKAAGRIIGAACSDHPAFSASYDLVTDEYGVTKRLSVRTSLASGDRQASVSRDDEGYWMVENSANHQRSTYSGALDVDMVLSPFFNTLPIRRFGLPPMSTRTRPRSSPREDPCSPSRSPVRPSNSRRNSRAWT